MYLKRLEMTGFKSFANRTELEFVPGVTAVVGPNGSGKSNVTDGIRWVLGEQSAKSLRGAKMEDVIFAGSDSRKPVGYCEVSMTFDNSERRLPVDYTEVTVTRRVYRSGESEYFLNRQLCRLKDINELFMDTGIGKDAYSMIGQGKIDEILSTKSEDRRAIFEEAAGIVKYKARKKEAEKRLDGTEQNLSRIHDLIHELDTQVQPLEIQAEKARQFKELKTELQKVEVGLYVHKIETLHEQWQQATRDIKQLTEEQVTLSAEVSKKEAALEELKFQLNEHEQTWEQMQSELLTVSEELEKAEGQKEVYLERTRNRQFSEQQLAERMQHLAEELDRLQKEEERIRQRLAEKKQELARAECELGAVQQKISLTRENSAEQLAELTERLQLQGNQLVALRSEKQYANEQLKQLVERLQSLEQQEENLYEQKQLHTGRTSDLADQLSAVEAELKQAAEQIRSLAQRKSEIEREEKALFERNRKAEQQLNRLRSQWELLKEMETEHQGFFQGVKEILQARDRGAGSLKGVHGAVAQLIQVPVKYEAAMETALGGALQHLVVEDEHTGRQGISYLKEKRLGRATFLPLDVLQGRYLPAADLAKLKNLSGFVGVAADLVHSAERYRGLVQHLLGLVIVAETLEQANRIARQLQYRFRVVTLEGDVVNPGGSMSGGSRHPSKTNLLGRSRQLEELEKEIASAKEIWSEVSRQLESLEQQKAHIEQEWEQVRVRGEERRVKEQELRGLERELSIQRHTVNEHLEQVAEERQELTAKQQTITAHLEELDRQMKQLEQENEQLDILIQQIRVQVKQQETSKEEAGEKITEWKVALARLNQETANLEENLERVQSELTRVQKQQRDTENEFHLLEEQRESHLQEMEQLDRRIEQLRSKKEQVQIRLGDVRQKRERMIRDRDAQEQDVRLTQQQLRKQEAVLKDQEVRVNRLDVELNHLLQKLAEEYEISFERAKETYELPDESGQAERRVRSLKSQLAALGEVNLGAIEEHQRLTERLQFLKTQEADLLEAKQKLYEIISQMEAEMGKRFEESFELIRAEFRHVFVQMFGGGRADLHLSDPDHLLETGVEIVAQPPGKKLQNLTLLSGGERALTAIALLFAVLRVKPVPFCVLDEVDAALDEANLTRFTRYLRKFASRTQFIIITHRKQTMEGADVLYGITMQESGVSKLVSVKLEEYDGQREIAATHG
ncbi:chromosome segregation protein SMC [Paenactinomyces guangxiensis]|uniref:Chromosome partition protein Smc n=1 Tax=Paenactinomyces guangxiensis TaxID=1490290 RepID=A0A7W2A900_9BACL|nr:chromosome segregation protein SMC [Paenactinomyces guangxiensis]MBA4494719.1 chromosome segregation protein SMC [Paenactinomyces guangxiensis]MBH8591803.1 chromosome segregation protein SMC [Paenactinomyces guangxiensis]